ncbi:MAG: type II secretion system F family protein [Anaerolineales bacterium]
MPRRVVERFSPADEFLLQHAGVDWSLGHFMTLHWLLFCMLAVAAFLVGILRQWDLMGIFLGAVLVAMGLTGPTLWLHRRVEARRFAVERALPDFIDRLVLGLEAGLGLEPVLRRTASNFPGLLGRELEVLIHHIDLGHSRSEALQQLAVRNPSPQVSAFVTALRQSDRLGTSLAGILRVQSVLLRSSRRRLAQEAGRRLPILIVFPLVFFLLPALLIVYLAPPLLHLILGR